MSTIITRAGKGSALTHNQLDTNFKQAAQAKTANYTVAESDNRDTIECSGTFTVTLPDVTTVVAAADTGDFQVTIKNTGTGVITIARTTALDTIDGAAANITLNAKSGVTLKANQAGGGYNKVFAIGADQNGIADAGGYFTGTEVETVTQEIGSALGNQASTAQGGTGTENGANTWAKLAEFVPTPAGNLAFKYHGVIVGEAFSGSVEFVINHYTSGTEWGGQVFIVNRADLDTTIPLNGIKLASNAAGNALGLWMKKTLVDRKYQLKEIAKTGEPEITYFTDAPWTATDPATGAGFVLTSAASEFATDVLEAHVGAINIDIAGNAATATNADLLDGQHGSYYQNASNLNAGTISDDRLPATITSNITGNAATATNATSADSVDAGSGVDLKTKVIEIGDWNMDADVQVNISLSANGLTRDSVRGISSVLILNDGGQRYDFGNDNANTGDSIEVGSASIILSRTPGGIFDNANYDSTSYNRGWVIVHYV